MNGPVKRLRRSRKVLKEAASLGMDASITRRDFVGGTLIGAGVALAAAASPLVMARSASAQVTPGLDMANLGRDWTGPGGIGDYAACNGNTADVVNTAHTAIRLQANDPKLRSASDTNEDYDLIVVGGGIAGVTAAYSYLKERPNASVLLLDIHPIFGGEAKQNEFEVDGTHLWAPQGSTGMVYPRNRATDYGWFDEFYNELDFPDEWELQEPTGLSSALKIPSDIWTPMHIGWEQADIGYYFEGCGFVKNVWEDGWRNAPIDDKTRISLLTMVSHRTAPVVEDWERYLDSMTYLDFLKRHVGVGEEVSAYFNPVMASMGCGLGMDVISAYSAYNYMMPGVINYVRDPKKGLSDPSDQLYLVSLPGGNTAIARRLVQKILPDAFPKGGLSSLILGSLTWKELDRPGNKIRMRLGAAVVAVEHQASGSGAKHIQVTYLKDGKLLRTRGRSVAVCGQQHSNKHICRDLPESYRDAMNAFAHAPMLTVNVAIRNWRFLEKAGISCARWFEGFGWWTGLRRNVVLDGKPTQPLDPSKPYVLTSYNPFCIPGTPFPDQCTAARMTMFSMSYSDIELAVREQYQKMFGPYGFDAKRDIAGIITNRQGHAYVVDPPGFYFGRDGKPAAKDVLRERFDRVAFGHSELTGAQMWETAATEGRRAAKQLLEVA
jgi:spermidine dehydrogenase